MDAILGFCRKAGIDEDHYPATWSMGDIQSLVLELVKREVSRDHAHGEATPPGAKGEQRFVYQEDCPNCSGQRAVGYSSCAFCKKQFVRVDPVAPQVEPNPGSLDGCYCSDHMSAGIPCPPGKCPNVPKRQAPQVEPQPYVAKRPKAPHGCEPEAVLAAAVRWFHACTDAHPPCTREATEEKRAALDALDGATRCYIYLDPEPKQAPQVEPGQAERQRALAEALGMTHEQSMGPSWPAEWDELLGAAGRLRSKLERLTKERDEARDGIAIVTQDRGWAYEQRDAAEDKLSASQAEVERLTGKRDDLESAYLSARSALRGVGEQLYASEERVKALEVENAALSDLGEWERLRSENARLAKELAEHVAAKAASDAPRPIVVGSTWQWSVAPNSDDTKYEVTAVYSDAAMLINLTNGVRFRAPFATFYERYTFVSDPPPQPIPAGEGGA